MYRVTQEALENMIRHAGATQAAVEVRSNGGQVELIIRDNGIGFEPSDKKLEDRFGLFGLHERAKSVAGQLEVDSQPGQGTQIKFTWEKFND